MFKYIFVFFCSFSLFISQNVLCPMKKDSKYGDHICLYTEFLEDHKSKTYVKPCEEGKYCARSGIQETGTFASVNFYVCKNFTNQFQVKLYNEDCTSDFECDSGLKCNSQKCTRDQCSINQKAYKTNSGSWSFKNNDLPKENYYYYCYSFNDNSDYCNSDYPGTPDYLKLKGIINFENYDPVLGVTNKGVGYRVKSRESSYKGSVDDGTFVTDYETCKSGYALYFYHDRSAKDPCADNSNRNKMYLMCVTLKSYDKNKDIFIYNINGDEDKIYYSVHRGSSSYFDSQSNAPLLLC